MSTEHKLLETFTGNLEVIEQSCEFSLYMCDGCTEPDWIALKDLSLDQLKLLNQKLTNVISYYDDDYTECKVDY